MPEPTGQQGGGDAATTEPGSGCGMMALMPDDTWVRDRMAIERTSLANERTLLAYVRTAIALFAGGATAIHFLESAFVDVIGWVMIAGGVVRPGSTGGCRFRKVSGPDQLACTATAEQPTD